MPHARYCNINLKIYKHNKNGLQKITDVFITLVLSPNPYNNVFRKYLPGLAVLKQYSTKYFWVSGFLQQ